MPKFKVSGTYPDLHETARRLGMSKDEVKSVERIVKDVLQHSKGRGFSLRKANVGDKSARSVASR